MRFAIFMLAAAPLFAQGATGDEPVKALNHQDSAWSQFLKANPNATELTHQNGQLHFAKPDHTQTVILGGVTHQDSKTGKCTPNDPVLSSTGNGWRLDGTANSVIIRKAGPSQHAITQTFSDFAAKHDSSLTVTVPTLTYG